MSVSMYNRESLFEKNIVDGRKELDLGSLNLPALDRVKDVYWTIVSPNEAHRPDLLSYRIYGTDELWWVIPWYNGIQDVWHDLNANVALKYIPKSIVEEAIKRKYVGKTEK